MDEATLAALDHDYLQANRAFVCAAERGEYVERHDVAIVSCGLRAQNLNWGFLKPPYPDVAASAERVRAFFAERKLPFQLTFRDPARAPVRALVERGWRERGDPVPGMALALPAEVPPPPAGLRVHEVRTPEQLARFRETAFQGFGYPVAVAPLFMNERLLALPHVRLYAGSAGGAVVATSLLVVTGSVAGIYWVATLEAARGRGYGAALTWAAVAGGQAAGCRVASLQASHLGRPVYAGMGFAHVLDYEVVLPPES